MALPEEILEWAQGRPVWQRDALRRLVQTPELTEADLAELLELCLSAHGLVETEVEAVPLTAEHLVAQAEDQRSVLLLEVGDVENANAIHSEQPLVFAPEGITLIFGQNGAGKSGYIRLLKQVCRARGERPTVLPNVYRDSVDAALSARIRYSVDGTDQELTWRPGAHPPPELQLVSIFDHECASVYTDERCDVAFLPLGLDLLPRLTDVCQTLQRLIDQEIRSLRFAAALPAVPADTEAQRLLGMLDHPEARGLVDKTAVFPPEARVRLEELQRHLGTEDPGRRAEEFEARATRIEEFTRRLVPRNT
jgi:hypothetical protein